MHHTNDYCTDLRQHLLKKRRSLSATERHQGSAQITQILLDWVAQQSHQPLHIAGFWPIGLEVDTRPLLNQLHACGHQLSLPIIIELDSPLVFYQWTPETPMQAGHFKIPEPVEPIIAPTPDIVLVPVLGFTLKGDRLGYGKGYYDRTLAQWHTEDPRPITIGIAWNEGLIKDPRYQAAAHDQRLDRIICPSGLVGELALTP